MLLNDRLYTVIFWGAISLTLHALIIVLTTHPVAESDQDPIQVSIVHAQQPTSRAKSATLPVIIPTTPTSDSSSQPVLNPTEPASMPEQVVPSALTEKETADTLAAAPVVMSTEGIASVSPSDSRHAAMRPVERTDQPAAVLNSDQLSKAREKAEPSRDRTTMDATTIIERLVDEDEREVAERLAEIPTTNTPYWNYLMQRLAQPEWHHKQFNFRSLKRQRTLALDLEFYPNGIVRAARIVRSSGLEALDAAAIRASYAAAPYTPPPTNDRQYGYIYRIKLQYLPGEP